jgi:putative iron-dependent peroxidase
LAKPRKVNLVPISSATAVRRTLEQMLENMFVGRPPGNYDRLLDFSRAVTGNLFFAPSATFLEQVMEG